MGDKAYYSRANRRYLRRRGVQAVIPERADQIGVVADGGIVELGSHAELVAAGGRYAQLYRNWVGSLAATTD